MSTAWTKRGTSRPNTRFFFGPTVDTLGRSLKRFNPIVVLRFDAFKKQSYEHVPNDKRNYAREFIRIPGFVQVLVILIFISDARPNLFVWKIRGLFVKLQVLRTSGCLYTADLKTYCVRKVPIV